MAETSRIDSWSGGKVYLVGAGPGAAGLITLRGVEVLRRADVVLYDYLVNPQILQHAPERGRTNLLGAAWRITDLAAAGDQRQLDRTGRDRIGW